MFGLANQAEHELQLFLVEHYLRRGFDLWNPAWHGGFSMAFHPPGFFVLIASLARFIGVERAYAMVVAMLPVGLTVASATLVWARSRQDDQALLAVRNTAWFVAVQPLVYAFVFPLGQTPFACACVFALLAAASMEHNAWRATHRLRGAVFTATALGLTALMHPAALALVLPLALGVLYRYRRAAPEVLIAWLAPIVISIFIVLFSLMPFFASLRGHASDPTWAKLSVQDNWRSAAVWALMLATVVATAAMQRRLSLAGGLALGFLLLGLSVVFPPLSVPFVPADKWLFLAALSVALSLPSTLSHLHRAVAGWFLLMSLFTVGAQGQLGLEHRYKRALNEVIDLMNGDAVAAETNGGGARYRYISLGLLDDRLQLGRKVPQETVDGAIAHYVGVALDAKMPVRSMDALNLSDNAHRLWLTDYLQRDRHVRFAVVADPRARKLLEEAGFFVRNAWGSGVVLWQRRNAEPLPVSTVHDIQPLFVLAPIILWLVLLGLALLWLRTHFSSWVVPTPRKNSRPWARETIE